MYTETELIGIAKRENNKKRNYLVVNQLQGKHIPVSPKKALEMFDALAGQVKEAYGNETLLLIGFAETATAIGARLSIQLDSFYMQTTREEIPGADYLFFSEAHSHATEQKLVRTDIEKLLGKAGRVVFVEDEVTTGNTILNIIDILEKAYTPKVCFSVASLINGMDTASMQRYADRGIHLHYLVKTSHENYINIAERYAGDGINTPLDASNAFPAAEYKIDSYINARRATSGHAYEKACEAFRHQIKDKITLEGNQNILVLGTEEFMYPALFLGVYLERCGHTVKCHSTTRSPIEVSSEKEYPLKTRYELISLYDDERKTFLYNLERYNHVFIVTDAKDTQTKGICSLVNALASCGNQKILLFRWCEV